LLVFSVRGRYAVLFSKGDVRLLEEEVPEPKGNEVLVRVGACGVCTGDLYAYLGYRVWFSTPARFADLLPALEGGGSLRAVHWFVVYCLHPHCFIAGGCGLHPPRSARPAVDHGLGLQPITPIPHRELPPAHGSQGLGDM